MRRHSSYLLRRSSASTAAAALTAFAFSGDASTYGTSSGAPLLTTVRGFCATTRTSRFRGAGNQSNGNDSMNEGESSDMSQSTSIPRATARRKRRAVVPEDEDMASLHAEDALAAGGMNNRVGGDGWGSSSSSSLPNSASAVSNASAMGGLGVPMHAHSIPMYFAPKSSANGGNGRDSLFDENDEMGEEEDVQETSEGHTTTKKKNIKTMGDSNPEYVDDESGHYNGSGASGRTFSSSAVSHSMRSKDLFLDDVTAALVAERQQILSEAPLAELHALVCAYLRSTENTRLVRSEEEHILFPVLIDRMNECTVLQLLEVVECYWARSTLVRYGSHFKDLVRDRIAVIATEAARQREEKRTSALLQNSLDGAEDPTGGGEGEGSAAGEKNDEDVYGDEQLGKNDHAPKKVAQDDRLMKMSSENEEDVILQRAMEEMNPDTVLRCIIVMGMSAGRRKRDLEFFQVLGAYLVLHINHYKNPRDLVRVLTAFSRAKIVPSNAFLGLLSRRFAVLNKKSPLGALPSYRAFVNLYKMGFDQMNSFRFLADRIFETIDQNVKLEKKQKRMRELLAASAGAAAAPIATTTGATNKKKTAKEKLPTPAEERKKKELEQEDSAARAGATPETPTFPDPETLSIRTALAGDVIQSMEASEAARQRFQLITELRPPMFTKLLLVLARFGAPHQQYLRPVIEPLLLPTFRHFSPPAFARFLRVLRLFRTTDRSILEPVVDFMADELGPRRVLLNDLLEMLSVMAYPDVPMLRNFDKMILLCHDVFKERVGLRPGEMCIVAAQLFSIQRKEEVPLEATEALTRVMDSFANRMCDLMDLKVLSLTHAEVFVDLCRQMQHPDEFGAVERLSQKRHAVNASEESDDGYYSALDIDVRELFHKAQFVNSFNTFGSFRPTPGALQVDFKQALTEVSVEVVLEAAHLHNLAFPGCMIPTLSRHMSRSILAKLAEDGEEVVTAENTIEIRPTQPVFMTNEGLERFAALLRCSPLTRARNSVDVWSFVRTKAELLKNQPVKEMADSEIERIVMRRSQVSTTSVDIDANSTGERKLVMEEEAA